MSVARSRLIQRFGRDWMIYALFHCGVEYLISQNSGFWDSLYVNTDANSIVHALPRRSFRNPYPVPLFAEEPTQYRGVSPNFPEIWADSAILLQVEVAGNQMLRGVNGGGIAQGGRIGSADILSVRAASVEWASGWGIDG